MFQIEQTSPSFFEVTVAMAFDWFAREKVDIAVIETGLGGRLDSTNVITPELSLITNISWDHADILGDSLEKIASEKAGIIKPGVPVVISERQPEVTQVFMNKAELEKAQIFFATDDILPHDMGVASTGLRKVEINNLGGDGLVTSYLDIGLLGEYQLKNLAGVLKAVEVLQKSGWNIRPRHILRGIKHMAKLTGLKGRWQILSQNPLTICDTAHNEAGIRLVAAQLGRLTYRQLHMVIGMVNDKDLTRILPLLPTEATYYFCQADIARALPADNLARQAAAFGLHGKVVANVNQAFSEARRHAAADDVIFIGGSTFVVAELDEL